MRVLAVVVRMLSSVERTKKENVAHTYLRRTSGVDGVRKGQDEENNEKDEHCRKFVEDENN